MSARVAALWRHPIKSHGREALQSVTLTQGQTMPWDRRWAVAHEASKADGSRWVPCANFSRGAKAPGLMAISATSDETLNTVTLSHPKLGEFTFDPDKQLLGFLDWVRPIMPADRAQSAKIIRNADVGMTDTRFPSISLLGLALVQQTFVLMRSSVVRNLRRSCWGEQGERSQMPAREFIEKSAASTGDMGGE